MAEESFGECFSLKTHLIFGFFIRILALGYGLIQDQLAHLPYTDIDYIVFTDGARYMRNGRSPFLRHGYRYSPIFAALLVPNVLLFKEFGKFLFAAFDVANGHLIYKILVSPKIACSHETALKSAIFWIYNPLPIVISTRGSSDSIITFLILSTMLQLMSKKYLISGLCYGLAIHCRLYPIIYSLPIFFYFAGRTKSIFNLQVWTPFNKKRILFFGATIVSFTFFTYISYRKYGQLYLKEAWLYHLTRHDTAHNFSPFFYLYKLKQTDEKALKLLSMLAFVPQILAIIYYSGRYCICNEKRHRTIQLILAVFSITYLFVSFNKVITSQYFIWYLSLLPLVEPFLRLDMARAVKLFTLWCFGQLQWLVVAYLYQYQRWNCLEILAGCSFVFLIINLLIQRNLERNFDPEMVKRIHQE